MLESVLSGKSNTAYGVGQGVNKISRRALTEENKMRKFAK
jgi:hypothetical protein